jgi:hypothetical protein
MNENIRLTFLDKSVYTFDANLIYKFKLCKYLWMILRNIVIAFSFLYIEKYGAFFVELGSVYLFIETIYIYIYFMKNNIKVSKEVRIAYKYSSMLYRIIVSIISGFGVYLSLIENNKNGFFYHIMFVSYCYNVVYYFLYVIGIIFLLTHCIVLKNIDVSYVIIIDDITDIKQFMRNRVNIFGEISCSICLEDYKNNDDLKGLKCSHSFHKECIADWLNKNNTCPLCRQITV